MPERCRSAGKFLRRTLPPDRGISRCFRARPTRLPPTVRSRSSRKRYFFFLCFPCLFSHSFLIPWAFAAYFTAQAPVNSGRSGAFCKKPEVIFSITEFSLSYNYNSDILYRIMPKIKDQESVHAYVVNQRISNVCRIAKAASQRSNSQASVVVKMLCIKCEAIRVSFFHPKMDTSSVIISTYGYFLVDNCNF